MFLFKRTPRRLITAAEFAAQTASAKTKLMKIREEGFAFLNKKIIAQLTKPTQGRPHADFSVPLKFMRLMDTPADLEKHEGDRQLHHRPGNVERHFDVAEQEAHFQPVLLLLKTHGWSIDKLSLTFAADDETRDVFYLQLTLVQAA